MDADDFLSEIMMRILINTYLSTFRIHVQKMQLKDSNADTG